MRAEIISIGTEITSGQNLDTNAQWLSRQLAEIGIVVGWHTTIADDLEINLEAFRIASKRAHLTLVTGGLGPTQDDLTREVMAQVAGVELIHDPDSEDRIRKIFEVRNREMPESNRCQAYFPKGAEPLLNECGTAPGVWLKTGQCWFGAMPGVPREMKVMYANQVVPRLLKLGIAQGVQLERKINCFGASESQVEEKLMGLTRRDHVPEVGITASNATISLRILARAENREAAEKQIAPVEAIIRERLGEWVFGADEERLEHAVLQLLAEQRKSLTVVEGVTGGWLTSMLTSVSGSSHWFRGGVIAYDQKLKTVLAHVPSELIEEHGIVSSEVAEAMARGGRAALGSDFALSTVGVAGENQAGPGKQPGLVYVALASGKGVISKSHSWLASREEIQSRTAKMALNLLRLQLLHE